MKLTDLNTKSESEFLQDIGGPLEGELWLAQCLIQHRPFADVDALYHAFETVIQDTSESEKVKLIASHPDLAPSVDTKLSEASVSEQAAAGLNRLTAEEYEVFNRLNTAYHAKFGFPFVICARENTKSTILSKFEARLENSRTEEIETGITEILKIIHLRLIDLIETAES